MCIRRIEWPSGVAAATRADADRAAGAADVLDDDLLLQGLGHALRDDARDRVARAAGRDRASSSRSVSIGKSWAAAPARSGDARLRPMRRCVSEACAFPPFVRLPFAATMLFSTSSGWSIGLSWVIRPLRPRDDAIDHVCGNAEIVRGVAQPADLGGRQMRASRWCSHRERRQASACRQSPSGRHHRRDRAPRSCRCAGPAPSSRLRRRSGHASRRGLSRIRASSTIRPSSMKRACASAPAGQHETFRQRDPFDVPGAGGALEVLHHRVEHQAGLLAHGLGVGEQHLGGDRIALLRHRARSAAMSWRTARTPRRSRSSSSA